MQFAPFSVPATAAPASYPHLSGQTIARAYGDTYDDKITTSPGDNHDGASHVKLPLTAKPGLTPQPIEVAVAAYDKSPSAALAFFFMFPTAGLSVLAFLGHHSICTKEKIDENHALAKDIMKAPVTCKTLIRNQLTAGGFFFTDVWYQRESRLPYEQRVLIRKAGLNFSQKIDRLENQSDPIQPDMPADLIKVQDQPGFPDMDETGLELSREVSWDDKLLAWGNDPGILIPGKLTVREIQARATHYIKTKAEEEVRCYISASLEAESRKTPVSLRDSTMLFSKEYNIKTKAGEEGRCNNKTSLEAQLSTLRLNKDHNEQTEKELIQIAGVYALAEAMLAPAEATSRKRALYVQQYIAKNADSLKTIQDIFGFAKPSLRKQEECKDECDIIEFRFDEDADDFKDSAGRLIKNTLEVAIKCCFQTLDGLYKVKSQPVASKETGSSSDLSSDIWSRSDTSSYSSFPTSDERHDFRLHPITSEKRRIPREVQTIEVSDSDNQSITSEKISSSPEVLQSGSGTSYDEAGRYADIR